MRLILALLVVLAAAPPQASARTPQKSGTMWLTVYYPVWAMRGLGANAESVPPWDINWSGVTHVVHFHNGTTVDTSRPPYFKPVTDPQDSIDTQYQGISNPGAGPGSWINWQDTLIRIVHRSGAKIVFNIESVDARWLNTVVRDSTRTQQFVNSAVAYCERKGYDGLEVNVESWVTPLGPAEHYKRLLRVLRRRLDTMKPRGLLLIAAQTHHERHWSPSQNDLVDQYNIMMYDYVHAHYSLFGRNASWFVAPLRDGRRPLGGFEGMSYESRGAAQWIAAGHAPGKIGMGMPLFGWVLRGVDTPFQPMESGGDYGYLRYQEALALRTNGGVERWDAERSVPFIAGTALRDEGGTWWGASGVKKGQKFFATYEDPRSLDEKIRWASGLGLGGVMLYDLTKDLDVGQPFGLRNPLLNSVRESMQTKGLLPNQKRRP
jgi:GH18 family chitinase